MLVPQPSDRSVYRLVPPLSSEFCEHILGLYIPRRTPLRLFTHVPQRMSNRRTESCPLPQALMPVLLSICLVRRTRRKTSPKCTSAPSDETQSSFQSTETYMSSTCRPLVIHTIHCSISSDHVRGIESKQLPFWSGIAPGSENGLDQ